MKTPNFSNSEFVDQVALNNAAVLTADSLEDLCKALHIAGLLGQTALVLAESNMDINVTAPLPFRVLFGSGVLASANGTTNGASTDTASVNFAPLVPGSGSITAYLIATASTVQQNPYQVIGPPLGHPDYSASFAPYTAYSEIQDTLVFSATTTAPDNLVDMEICRVTLTAGQTVITSAEVSTASQQLATAVLGNAAVQGNLTVAGNETVGGTLAVTGNETVGGTLAVTGTASAAPAAANGQAAVMGNTPNAGNLTIAGTIAAAVAAANGQAAVMGNTPNAGNLIITGNASVAAATQPGQAPQLAQVQNTLPMGATGALSSATSVSATTPTFTAPSAGALVVMGFVRAGNSTITGSPFVSSPTGIITDMTTNDGYGGLCLGHVPMTNGQTVSVTLTVNAATGTDLSVQIVMFFLPLG